MKVIPLIVLDRFRIVPFGWVSCADTISSERSVFRIAECSTKVQVTMMLFIGLDGVLVRDTEAGGGTEEKEEQTINIMFGFFNTPANLLA